MKKDDRVRNALLGLAVARILVGLAAIPLAPFLYEKHFVVLVLMRPTKEVLLAAGFLLRLDKIGFIPVVAAAIPLAILGVWHSYYLGRYYSTHIRSGRAMPWWMKRVLRPDRVQAMQKLLKRKGMKLVVLGRLAVFPSTVVGAAAGAGDIPSRRFLPADALGGVLSIAEAIGAGFALGYAYKSAGPWITAIGLIALIGIAVLIAQYLKREDAKNGRSGGRGRSKAGASSRS